jgi:Rieske Fe-S protein
MSDETRTADPTERQDREMGRRDALKAFVGLGLASGIAGCASGAAQPGPVPAQAPAASAEPGTVASTTATARPAGHEHPADGDALVFAFGDREGQMIAAVDVPADGPQIFAYPADPDGTHVASASRLDQLILVRVDPAGMTEETAARAVEGIVAYSAVCTHEGCDIDDWDDETRHLVCPCHDSVFDPSDNGRVAEGPARRRLASLPLRVVDGMLVAAGPFSGRVGFPRG